MHLVYVFIKVFTTTYQLVHVQLLGDNFLQPFKVEVFIGLSDARRDLLGAAARAK